MLLGFLFAQLPNAMEKWTYFSSLRRKHTPSSQPIAIPISESVINKELSEELDCNALKCNFFDALALFHDAVDLDILAGGIEDGDSLITGGILIIQQQI